jgi:hypothetical protein
LCPGSEHGQMIAQDDPGLLMLGNKMYCLSRVKAEIGLRHT